LILPGWQSWLENELGRKMDLAEKWIRQKNGLGRKMD
jgi:hypothetical protein